jgi:hypothetical protein
MNLSHNTWALLAQASLTLAIRITTLFGKFVQAHESSMSDALSFIKRVPILKFSVIIMSTDDLSVAEISVTQRVYQRGLY